MAVIYDRDNNSYTHTSVPNNYSRGNPIPLDDSSIWLDAEKAKTYAKNGATAYVGQQLTIIDTAKSTVTIATISSIDGNMVELANRNELSNLNTKIGNLGPSDVGLGNVANVLQYSESNPPPYPISAIVIDGLASEGTTIAKIKINDTDELSIKIPVSNDYLAKDALNTLSVKWDNAYLSAQFLSNLTQAIPSNPQFTDTTYEPATSTAPGLLKISAEISSNAGRIYPVMTDGDKVAYVWVPWTDEGGGEVLVDGTTINKDKDNKLYVVVGGISAALSTSMLPVFQVKGNYLTSVTSADLHLGTAALQDVGVFVLSGTISDISANWNNAYVKSQILSNLTTAIPADAKFTDTTYEPANSSTPGLLKIDAEISSNTNRTYSVVTDSDGKAFVWVPWIEGSGGDVEVDDTTIGKNTQGKLYVKVGGISADLSTSMIPVFQAKGDYVTVTDNTLLSAAVETISNDYLTSTDKNAIIGAAGLSVDNLSAHTDATFSSVTAKIDQNDENAQLSVAGLSDEVKAHYLKTSTISEVSANWNSAYVKSQILSNLTTAIPADAKFTDTVSSAADISTAIHLDEYAKGIIPTVATLSGDMANALDGTFQAKGNYLTNLSDDTSSQILSTQVQAIKTEAWTFYTDEHPEGIIKNIVVV